MENKDNRSKSRIRRIDKDEDDFDISVICSKSYIVPGNPMAPKHNGSLTNMTPYDRLLMPISRQDPFIRNGSPIVFSRRGTPIPREKVIRTPIPREKKRRGEGFYLPEINMHGMTGTYKENESLGVDGLLPQYIRKTKSGISWSYLYGPPTSLPSRLPRIVSEGEIESRSARRRREEASMRGAMERYDEERGSRGNQSKTNIHRSGGKLADSLRTAAETNRQQRELRNMEVTRSKIQLNEDRASRLGRYHENRDDRSAQVQQVLSKQDEIREKERRRLIDNFMKNKKK